MRAASVIANRADDRTRGGSAAPISPRLAEMLNRSSSPARRLQPGQRPPHADIRDQRNPERDRPRYELTEALAVRPTGTRVFVHIIPTPQREIKHAPACGTRLVHDKPPRRTSEINEPQKFRAVEAGTLAFSLRAPSPRRFPRAWNQCGVDTLEQLVADAALTTWRSPGSSPIGAAAPIGVAHEQPSGAGGRDARCATLAIAARRRSRRRARSKVATE